MQNSAGKRESLMIVVNKTYGTIIWNTQTSMANVLFQVSTKKQIRTVLLWVNTQQTVVISY